MSDNKRSVLAGLLFVAGALIGGMIMASGVLANWPGADTLMALALAMLVPATLLLVYWLRALDKDTDEPVMTIVIDAAGRELRP